MGYQILAISPDVPKKINETLKKHGLNYSLLSDKDLRVAREFGIGFGKPGKRQLPVPAAFVLDGEGVIHFQYVNPNYRVRLDMEVLMAAARAALKE